MILAIHSLFSPLGFATIFVICALRRNMRSVAFSRKDLNPTELLLVAVLRLGPNVLLLFRSASLNSSDTTLESLSPRRTFRSVRDEKQGPNSDVVSISVKIASRKLIAREILL
jgi:hypothetical protein